MAEPRHDFGAIFDHQADLQRQLNSLSQQVLMLLLCCGCLVLLVGTMLGRHWHGRGGGDGAG